jgi:hypothetical protein
MTIYDPLGDYDRVGKIAPKLKPENIEVYTPRPTKRERQFGEITRYFVRFTTHLSAADILEVSNTTYTKLKRNPLYHTTNVRWRISGKLDDEFDLTNPHKPIRLYTGVVTANKLSIELANEEMPGLKDYIAEKYIRFWEF